MISCSDSLWCYSGDVHVEVVVRVIDAGLV